MKNISLILNVVLLIAVIVLYVLQFSGGATETDVPVQDSTATELGDLTVAYVDSDSLLSNYAFMDEIQEKLEKSRQEKDAQYQTRVKSLEREVNSFQRTMNTMTIGQARAVEEDLQKKQQNLILLRDQLSQSLLIEENNYQNEIYDNVAAYVKEYAEENDLHVVLNFQRGTGVIYANKGLEITRDILDGLNEEYRQSKEVPAESDSIQ